MNLGDPELELIDPTPNIHLLFIQFDKTFFWSRLASRVVVRWSKKMYSCAGICSYEGRGGLCDIAVSEPLLKLRPRKDLIETLLHEMIHAYLFVTAKDQDRDGHGPIFQSHMHRINRSAGLNISIYHDFHDEVMLYQTHWWRCNGPCQTKRPHFGIVRRSANRAPGPSEYWWLDHKRKCGGTFIKIKEPVTKTKTTNKKSTKPNADITQYINNNNNNLSTNKNLINVKAITTLKDFHGNSIKTNIRTINSIPQVTMAKNVNPNSPKPFSSQGHTLVKVRSRSNSVNALETVRNIWANKQISNTPNAADNSLKQIKNRSNPHSDSPPPKIKKIDQYFKKTASSLLKDVYGEDFKITQSTDGSKLIAVNTKKEDKVECPVCKTKVNKIEINKHLDECLNKDLIEKLSKDNIQVKNNSNRERQSIGSNVSKPMTKFNSVDLDRKITSNIKLEKDDVKPLDNKASTSAGIKIQPQKKVTFASNETENDSDIFGNSSQDQHTCACCGKKISKPIEQHLDECLVFFDHNTTIPEENNSTIVIDDDDDEFDESMTMNATGTKTPCPCCLEMVEQKAMNDHLDLCLNE
ncbi:sprT-like domain-containing protein Spartan [Bombyx mandarina]|uniref:Protein with SprT-like domain at the N terminus n=1 Tax=Bombyx mandarina TaxID=7092 RepID=A0A6J2JM37_BOMMA|nr:sprT-like domain-containing protein Spartan [Bombyx mandarina]